MPPTVFINWKQNFRLNQCCFPLVYKYEMQLFSDSKPIRVGNNLCVHLPTAVAQRTKLHAFYKTDYFQNSKHRFETLSKTQIDKSRPQTLAIENKKRDTHKSKKYTSVLETNLKSSSSIIRSIGVL